MNGAAVTEKITYSTVAPATYAVTFTESGLPGGSSWSVTLNGTPSSGTGTSIASASLPNGTYTFSVASVAGYTANRTSGTVHVEGAAVTVLIAFTTVVPQQTSAAPGPPIWLWAVIAVVIVAVIAVVALLLMRRRKPSATAPPGNSGSAAPGAPLPPPAGPPPGASGPPPGAV